MELQIVLSLHLVLVTLHGWFTIGIEHDKFGVVKQVVYRLRPIHFKLAPQGLWCCRHYKILAPTPPIGIQVHKTY